MMQRFSTTRLRNRPWLLLWLLPFLLLNFAGEALHNHPIFSDAEIAAHFSPRATHTGFQNERSHETNRADLSCLACQWHAFSAGHLVSPTALFAPPLFAAPRVLAPVVLHPQNPETFFNRGPPLSFA